MYKHQAKTVKLGDVKMQIFRLRGVNVVVVKLPKTLNPENQLANFGDSFFLGVQDQNVEFVCFGRAF